METIIQHATVEISAKEISFLRKPPAASRCVRLSQSEAMLEAMQAGFFEVFFEKRELNALLSDPRCQTIRFHFLPLAKDEKALAAIALDNAGHTLQTPGNYMLGTGTVNPDGASNCCVDFPASDLLQLLLQPDCNGIRLFPGLLHSRQRTLIAVGVNSLGFDIEAGAGYLRSRQVVFSHFA